MKTTNEQAKKEFEELWEDLNNSEGSYYTKKERVWSYFERLLDKERKITNEQGPKI